MAADILDILYDLDTLAEGSDIGPTDLYSRRIDIGDAQGFAATVSTRAASETLGCSERHVRRLLSSGRLPGLKHGHDWAISQPALDAYRFGELNSGKQET
ncbi:hypothetical protein GCM10027568_11020 [Humibacter soli]